MTTEPRKFTPDEIIKIVVEARRFALKELIRKKYGGQQSRFVEETGINQGELSGLLKKKHFGEKKARAIELQAGLPYLSLDQVFSPEGNVVPLSAREPDVADQVAALVRSMTAPGQYVTLGQVQQLAKQYAAQSNLAS